MEKRCKISQCKNKVQSRGWCTKHYARWFKHGDPNFVQSNFGINNPMYKHGKYCTVSYCKCGREKDYRAKFCALCSRHGYSKKGEKLVSDDKILRAIAQSSNFISVAESLGVSRQTITRAVKRLGADISHFSPGRSRPISTGKMLVKESIVRRGTVRKRVLEEKLLEYICKSCKLLPVWQGEKLILQLDHINGDSKDNRLDNLRWLCPNCHSQTSTHAGKRGKQR